MPLLPVRVLQNQKLFHLHLMVDCCCCLFFQIVLLLVHHLVLLVQTFLLHDVDHGQQLLQLRKREGRCELYLRTENCEEKGDFERDTHQHGFQWQTR